MITKIELIETLGKMGDATEEDLFRWRDNLRSVLSNQYPGTDVKVRAVADTGPDKIRVEVDDDTSATSAKDNVREVIAHCWDLWS